ncbi:MAG: secretion system protein [Halanaeroarchaeum sp.]
MSDPLPETVPPPVPPDHSDAWYAPSVRVQYRVPPTLVATVREVDETFEFHIREPHRSAAAIEAVAAVTEHLESVPLDRPRTREGTVERVEDGLPERYRRLVDDVVDPTPAQRRRIEYHLTAAVRGLGVLTPLALDERIRVADASGDVLIVHTDDFAPARTTLPADVPYLDRFLSERFESYTVPFLDYDVPVTVYRERLLGGDVFEAKYHVHTPTRLPGDEAIVAGVTARIEEESVGGEVRDAVEYVRRRARRLIKRRLVARSPATLAPRVIRLARTVGAVLGLGTRPLPGSGDTDRIDDLLYLVTRNLVGEDALTIPLRDPHLERIEANGVGERVKVVARPGSFDRTGRFPTTIRFDDERRFVALATRMAAAGGVELGPTTPHATVSIEPTEGAPLSCTVALPAGSAESPFISVDKRGLDPVTATTLLETGVVGPELVGLLWLLIERGGSIAFVGPERARPAALVEAHAPFVPFDDRPVTVTAGSRQLRLPHETGVSLNGGTVAATDDDALLDRVSDIGADVSVVTALGSRRTYEYLEAVLSAGQAVLVAANAAGIDAFVQRAVDHGVSSHTIETIDLVVETTVSDSGAVVEAVSLLVGPGEGGRPILSRGSDAIAALAVAPGSGGDGDFDPVFQRIAADGGEDVSTVAAEHRRRVRYVKYLQAAGVTDVDDLFSFLADLQTDEAATVERIHQVLSE